MEGSGNARECARRLLAKMAGTQDVETRRSLWKAALKYMRSERAGERENPGPLACAQTGGLVGRAHDGKG